MDPSKVPSFRRPRLAGVLLVTLLAVVMTSGCAHRRRSSMRPVYLAPAPVMSAPCEGAGCPPAPTSSAPLTVPSSEPALEPSSTSLGAPVLSSPAPTASPAPRYSTESAPPVTGPSLPGLSDEPELLPAPSESSKVTPTPSRGGTGTGTGAGTGTKGSTTTTPGSSMRTPDGPYTNTTRRAAPARPRRVSLRDDLAPYVNDPGDLFAPPKADRPWKYIVMHHSASESGGYAAIDQEHRKRLGWDGCGYHFIIGNGTETADGLIEVAQRWSNQKHGVHCRDGKHPDVNEYGIGICLVGDLENSPPTPKQIEAARALVAYLSERYAIPANRTETHAHVAASETTCPGRHFPTDSILSAANGVTQR